MFGNLKDNYRIRSTFLSFYPEFMNYRKSESRTGPAINYTAYFLILAYNLRLKNQSFPSFLFNLKP
jgi:hypothetical protein